MIDLERMLADAQALAKARGLSVRALCERANVAQSSWVRWKARKSSPTFATWAKIQRQLQNLAAQANPAASEQGNLERGSRAGHTGGSFQHPTLETERSPQPNGLPALFGEPDSRGASPSLITSSDRERRECAEEKS